MRNIVVVFVALAALGCGPSGTRNNNPVPCKKTGNVNCGMSCKGDADCGSGLHCDSGTCIADCVAGTSSCGDGQACDSTGRCVPAGGLDGGNVVVCPDGLMCNVSCTSGGTTTISGKVYDPAGKNGLYGVTVYVPQAPLAPLPKGVPTGMDACSCAALYTSGAVVSTSTVEDGTFVLMNAPVGSSVPLVIQDGKWRRSYTINVNACQDNAQADKSLAFLSTVPAGDTDDNIPDIAVSTGSADTLECLMRRIGLDASEYVAGAGTTGHVHIFAGGDSSGGGFGGGGGRTGRPEMPGMPGAPSSPTDLWATQAQLMNYDIVLLSCEGGETFNANPAAMEAYLNAGGRAFASHFHYSWFSGPLDSGQSYTAPADWGSNLATWAAGSGMNQGPVGGIIDTTLNGTGLAFPKGVSLNKWLGNFGALGKNGVPGPEVSIYQPRYNATVGTTNTPSQAWITSDASGMAGATLYLSFDTPINAPMGPDNGPMYCGRAVFSDLHVSGDPTTNDTSPPPGGCANTDLSPQEKALEFMLFDLSACVIPDTMPPPMGVPIN